MNREKAHKLLELYAFNRKPKSEEEFKQFCEHAENGLDSQIDWAMLFNCAKDCMDVME